MDGVIKKVLDKRTNSETGAVEYLLKWRKHSHKEDSWEQASNLICPKLIEKFEKKLKKKTKKEEKKAVASENRERVNIGFERGLEAKKVITLTDTPGQLFFVMQWVDDSYDLVPAAEANIRCPQVVIKFYENICKRVIAA